MDGIHDLGGMAGFGAIEVEANEPTFHEPWEGTIFALNAMSIGVLKAYNADEYRHSIERMPPAQYLNASYYERMLTGIATLLVEKEVVTAQALDRALGANFRLSQPNATVSSDGVEQTDKPGFVLGERVVVRASQTLGHTRVPRYVRGKAGVVISVTPKFNFPDASAHGLPPRSEHTYHVEFAATDLWGPDAEKNDSVVIDLWETYLEDKP